MLSKQTANKLRSIGFDIKKAEDAFVDACGQAMAEMHGTHWRRRRDAEVLVEHLEREVRLLLCEDKDGPNLGRDTFTKYWSGAKKSLLFHIPFRMAWNLSYQNCARVRDKAAKDRRKVDRRTKVEEAIKEIRAERRRSVRADDNGFLKLPRPTGKQGAQWVRELKSVISEALSHPAARPLFKKHPELSKLLQIVDAKGSGSRRGR